MTQERCRVAAFGDIMMERRLHPTEMAEVAPLLAPYDLVIGNVDAVMSLAGTPVPKWANLHAPRELAHDVKALGVDLLSLANNHMMDFGAEGLLDARRALDEAGVAHAGAGANLAEAIAPAYLEVNGRTIAFFSVSSLLAEGARATENGPGIAPLPVRQSVELDGSLILEQPGTVPYVHTSVDEAALARLTNEIAAAKQRAEIVLVAVHLGVPGFWRAPSHPILQEYEQPACRAMIDAGADAVLGCHAHELHPIEVYRGRPIVYSLANFWIDQFRNYPWMGAESMVLELTFPAGSSTPEVTFVAIRLDEAGFPRLDPTGRTADILREQSASVTINQIGESTYAVTAAG